MSNRRHIGEQDDQTKAIIDQSIEDFLRNEDDIKNFTIHYAHNGRPQRSRLDLGRNCPRCAGKLWVKEVREDEEGEEWIYLHCKDCKLQVFADDIDRQTETVNQLYNTIPKSRLLRYKQYMENRNKDHKK